MGAGDTGGVRPSMVGVVWGEGGKGAVPAGRGRCGTLRGGRGRLGRALVGLGWPRCGRARQVLDRVSADRAPASVGRGRGLVRWGCHGELQGGHRQAPGHAGSLLCCWLVASGHGGGMLCHGCLRARVSVWGG